MDNIGRVRRPTVVAVVGQRGRVLVGRPMGFGRALFRHGFRPAENALPKPV